MGHGRAGDSIKELELKKKESTATLQETLFWQGQYLAEQRFVFVTRGTNGLQVRDPW